MIVYNYESCAKISRHGKHWFSSATRSLIITNFRNSLCQKRSITMPKCNNLYHNQPFSVTFNSYLPIMSFKSSFKWRYWSIFVIFGKTFHNFKYFRDPGSRRSRLFPCLKISPFGFLGSRIPPKHLPIFFRHPYGKFHDNIYFF